MAKQEKNKEPVEEKKETPKKQAKPKAVSPKKKTTSVEEKEKKTVTTKKAETKETKEEVKKEPKQETKKEPKVAKSTTKKVATAKGKSTKTETNSKTSKQKSREPKKEEEAKTNKKQEPVEMKKQEQGKKTNSKSKNTASKGKQETVKKGEKPKKKETNNHSKGTPSKKKQEQDETEKKENHTHADTHSQTENTTNVETADELISVPEEELKKVKEERKGSRRLTKEQTEILKKNAFYNGLAAIAMIAYFILLTLAFDRMKPEVFTLDLKVFSGTFLATAILLFETAYKKEEGKWAIHGIEVLVIAIVTLLLTHLYVIAEGLFTRITLLLAGSAIVYYCIKCLVMVIRQIRKSKLQDVKKLLAEKSEIDTKERME